MKIAIISGSHRTNAQSLKVAQAIESIALAHNYFDSAWLYSLSDNPLPLWDESIWANNPEWNERLEPLKTELASSDAVVVIAPEWHGQAPAGLKNFFLMFSKYELGHKPGLLVGVSSADGGSYPIAELRMSSYKNNRICYIPEHLIIRNVESVLNADDKDNNPDADGYFRERIDWTLQLLQAYAKALKPIRESGLGIHDTFSNGM